MTSTPLVSSSKSWLVQLARSLFSRPPLSRSTMLSGPRAASVGPNGHQGKCSRRSPRSSPLPSPAPQSLAKDRARVRRRSSFSHLCSQNAGGEGFRRSTADLHICDLVTFGSHGQSARTPVGAGAVTQVPSESSHRTRSIAAMTAGSSGSIPSNVGLGVLRHTHQCWTRGPVVGSRLVYLLRGARAGFARQAADGFPCPWPSSRTVMVR